MVSAFSTATLLRRPETVRPAQCPCTRIALSWDPLDRLMMPLLHTLSTTVILLPDTVTVSALSIVTFMLFPVTGTVRLTQWPVTTYVPLEPNSVILNSDHERGAYLDLDLAARLRWMMVSLARNRMLLNLLTPLRNRDVDVDVFCER